MNIFTCNIFLFVAVSLLGFATPAHACEDGGQQYFKVNEYSSALNSEETVTSIRIVKGFWYGDVFITVGESERKITERASCAWIIGDGKEVAFASSGGAGGFENEGQTLHIYNVKTRETREVLSHYYMIDEAKEVKLSSGAKKSFVSTRRYERVTVQLKSPTPVADAFCPACNKNVNWVTLPEVCAITGHSQVSIKDKISTGVYDVQITSDLRLLVCVQSVFRHSTTGRI